MLYVYFVAAQMLLLARILPLAIGNMVPCDDEAWLCFLAMVEIIRYLFCPRINEDQAAYLQALISDHHTQFTDVYPMENITPKMHYMVHMPRLMIQ